MTNDMFGGVKLSDYTTKHKIDELEREIKVRKRVYKRWVEQGKLNAATADIRIRILVAILRDYKTQANRGEPSGDQKEDPQAQGN